MKLFISYRRSDSEETTGRIYDRLKTVFGREKVFRDIDTIPLQTKFADYLIEWLSDTTVVVAVIGPDWMTVVDKNGNRRIDDPEDYVRIEILTAMSLGIPIIPIVVRRAGFPRRDDLPEALRPLNDWNGLPVRPDPDFHGDMDKLIQQINGVSESVVSESSASAHVESAVAATRSELLTFKRDFMVHEPPSETDASLGYGNPDVEIRDIRDAFCEATARKFDLFAPIFKANCHLLPAESVQLLTKMLQRVKEGRMYWANMLRRPNTVVVGRDIKTAALEFHFHRLVTDAINFELERVAGREPSNVDLALHSISLRDGAGESPETDS